MLIFFFTSSMLSISLPYNETYFNDDLLRLFFIKLYMTNSCCHSKTRLPFIDTEKKSCSSISCKDKTLKYIYKLLVMLLGCTWHITECSSQESTHVRTSHILCPDNQKIDIQSWTPVISIWRWQNMCHENSAAIAKYKHRQKQFWGSGCWHL